MEQDSIYREHVHRHAHQSKVVASVRAKSEELCRGIAARETLLQDIVFDRGKSFYGYWAHYDLCDARDLANIGCACSGEGDEFDPISQYLLARTSGNIVFEAVSLRGRGDVLLLCENGCVIGECAIEEWSECRLLWLFKSRFPCRWQISWRGQAYGAVSRDVVVYETVPLSRPGKKDVLVQVSPRAWRGRREIVNRVAAAVKERKVLPDRSNVVVCDERVSGEELSLLFLVGLIFRLVYFRPSSD